jgi:transposase
MITPPAGTRILLATKPVDFRKGTHGLAALAAEVLGENPFSGVVVVFRSKRADRIKILIWDGSGLVLIWKQWRATPFDGRRWWMAYCG